MEGANKYANIYVGRSLTMHNLLFSAHTVHYELHNLNVSIGNFLGTE